MPTLYDSALSRNGLKIRLLAAQLGLTLERVEIDLLGGESRQPAFLAKNVAGRIPVLELEDGTDLAESNAILFFLAQGSALWPEEPLLQAETLRWMFFEQNMVESSIGTARFWRKIGRHTERPDAFAHRLEIAVDALSSLDRHLAGHDWLAAGRLTIADIALYAYVSVAEEAGLTLSDFPSVLRWLQRLQALPAFAETETSGAAA
jgi:glutathione S-transferase